MTNPRLTKTQRANLTKLADYLETLPKSYRHFDMSSFFNRGEFDYEDEVRYALENGGVKNCGTSACAIGHGPSAGILMPRKMAVDGWQPNWYAYTQLFIGTFDFHTQRRRFFEFMFGGHWDNIDNHHYGAAARIRFVLDKGFEAIPDRFGHGFESSTREDRKLYRAYDKRYAK